LQPRSAALCSERSDSSSSDPVQPPIPHIPYPISETCQPVRPKRLYFIDPYLSLLLGQTKVIKEKSCQIKLPANIKLEFDFPFCTGLN
jgi:hypothetical protein